MNVYILAIQFVHVVDYLVALDAHANKTWFYISTEGSVSEDRSFDELKRLYVPIIPCV